jgi:hypothetical protein
MGLILLYLRDLLYMEDFKSLDEFMTALHSGQCAACRKAHTNFADESADNVWHERK